MYLICVVYGKIHLEDNVLTWSRAHMQMCFAFRNEQGTGGEGVWCQRRVAVTVHSTTSLHLLYDCKILSERPTCSAM